MIRLDRIELTTYLNKPLDSVDFKAIGTLNSSSVRSNRIRKNLFKFNLKNLKFDSHCRFSSH